MTYSYKLGIGHLMCDFDIAQLLHFTAQNGQKIMFQYIFCNESSTMRMAFRLNKQAN